MVPQAGRDVQQAQGASGRSRYRRDRPITPSAKASVPHYSQGALAQSRESDIMWISLSSALLEVEES